jgi:hypothetical protein
MIYQRTLKEQIAKLLNVNPESLYNLPYDHWAEIRDKNYDNLFK